MIFERQGAVFLLHQTNLLLLSIKLNFVFNLLSNYLDIYF